MDGKNSSGRRISLLNDGAEPQQHHVRLPSIAPSLRSRTSSYTSSPIASPATPQLVRSHSSDSSLTMQTPSPITPEFAFEGNLNSPVFNQNSFFPSQKEMASAYPSLHPQQQQQGPLPYPANNIQPAYPFRPQQPADSHNGPASQNQRSKKNSYPCPVAKQYNCGDHFTTSGHAARHAKKHTGKKDAFCPECNKAFTRKDNMEQHRRTHQSGRNAGKGTDNSIKKAKAQSKRPKPSPLQSQSDLPPMAGVHMMDSCLPASPSQSFMAPAVQPTDTFVDFPQPSPYPDPTAYAMTHAFNPGSSYGLDALAIAASGEKRKYEC